ncbi:MAG: hypothetical protein F6K50_53890 [Moorea sp. SIO3I7]|nr:hypothetical protein [Moorena sp. SIO3I7]
MSKKKIFTFVYLVLLIVSAYYVVVDETYRQNLLVGWTVVQVTKELGKR